LPGLLKRVPCLASGRSGVQEKHLDSVAEVRYIHVARGRVRGNARWTIKLAVSRGCGSETCYKVASDVKHMDSVVAEVCHINTLPDVGFTATHLGLKNWPLPAPRDPHFAMKLPVLSNTWMRWLVKSATYTLPVAGLTATPKGGLNWPSARAKGSPLAQKQVTIYHKLVCHDAYLASPAVSMVPLQPSAMFHNLWLRRCDLKVLGDAASTDIESNRGATARAWKGTRNWGFGCLVARVTRIVNSDVGGQANPIGQGSSL
jgi:hypothetical protein